MSRLAKPLCNIKEEEKKLIQNCGFCDKNINKMIQKTPALILKNLAYSISLSFY